MMNSSAQITLAPHPLTKYAFHILFLKLEAYSYCLQPKIVKIHRAKHILLLRNETQFGTN